MLTLFLRISILAYVATLLPAYAQLLPDSQALVLNELEHLYLDNTGPNSFKSTITPCTNYADSSTGGLTNNTLGRQAAAQWIRTAFHDFATADVVAGKGGIDASIGFETHYPENIGPAFNDSLFVFAIFFNDKVSMADLIALGAAMAVGGCGGPQIPLRVGRIDAIEAGPAGVCQPETDLETTLARFSGAGFNQADAIALTACGHTMGGVHHSSFPQVVPGSAVVSDNLDGRVSFDDTVATYDNHGVQQYLSGTGNRGGPLVTSTNETVRSDLRLFESDQNATMNDLAQSSAHFASTCANLISRMINTVPNGVSLTPAIDPRVLKHVNITLEVDWSGTMTLSGFIRYIEVAGSPPAPESLKVSLIGRDGSVTKTNTNAVGKLATDTGNGIYGPTFPYPFTLNFPATTGLSGIAVGDQKFPLQDSLFVIQALSSIEPGLAEFNFSNPARVLTFNITAALLSSHPPASLKATFAIPVPQPGSMNPTIDSSSQSELLQIGQAGPFAIFSTIIELKMTSQQLFGASVDIVDESTGTVAMFFRLMNILQFF